MFNMEMSNQNLMLLALGGLVLYVLMTQNGSGLTKDVSKNVSKVLDGNDNTMILLVVGGGLMLYFCMNKNKNKDDN
jgi:hypothetical protein